MNGECRFGTCICDSGFIGPDCSSMLTLANVEPLDIKIVVIFKIVSQCTINFCDECSPGNTLCLRCQIGYNLDEGVCSPDQISLTDIEIAGKMFEGYSRNQRCHFFLMCVCVFPSCAAIVVGCSIAFILIVMLLICFTTFMCKSVLKSRSKPYAKNTPVRRRKPKYDPKNACLQLPSVTFHDCIGNTS